MVCGLYGQLDGSVSSQPSICISPPIWIAKTLQRDQQEGRRWGLCVAFAPMSGAADPTDGNELPSVRMSVMKQLRANRVSPLPDELSERN